MSVRPPIGAAAKGVESNSASRIFHSMLRKARSLLVVVVVALGLVAQGVGMPAMSAPSAGISKSQCQLMQSICPGSGMDQHPGVQSCQLPCVAPAALPQPNVTVGSVEWVPLVYSMVTTGLPPGETVAPDPFPPRSLTLV